MNVAYYFGASIFATNVAVKVAFLPELLALASQFARSHLLTALINCATRIAGGSLMSKWTCSGIRTYA